MLMDREIEYFKDVIVFKWICRISAVLLKLQGVLTWNLMKATQRSRELRGAQVVLESKKREEET